MGHNQVIVLWDRGQTLFIYFILTGEWNDVLKVLEPPPLIKKNNFTNILAWINHKDFHTNCVHSSRMFDKQETLHLHEQWAWDEPLPDVPLTTGSLGIAFAPQTHSRQTRSVWSDVREKVERIIHRTWLSECVLRSAIPWSWPGRLRMSR